MTTDWELRTLSETCHIKPAKLEAKQRLSDSDLVAFVPMEDLGTDQKFVTGKQTRQLSEVVGAYTYFADGDVLLAKITPCFENGKLGIARDLENGVGFGSSEYIVFRPKSRLDPQWLYYYLSRNSFRADGEIRMGGAVGHKRVAKEFIESYPIPVPPLAEQHRIVALLDEAFAGIAIAKTNAERNLQAARGVFDLRLTSVFSDQHPGWSKMRLEEICAITSPLVDPREKEYVDAIHIGAGNIESRTGRLVELKTSRQEGLISGKFPFDPSMVLYSKIRPYLMKVARPGFAGICSADMYPLAPIDGKAVRDFLYYLLLSKPFTDYAILGSARAGMPKVNREHLFQYTCSVPDVKSQVKIAAELDKLWVETRHLQSIYTRKLAAFAELKQSLLHQAFSGQL